MSAWIQKKSGLFISIIEFTNNNSEKIIKKNLYLIRNVVMIWLMSTCSSLVVGLHLFNSWLAFVLGMACLFWMAQRKRLSLCTTNVINKHWKITDQFLCYLFVENSMNGCYIVKCMNFLLKVTWHPWHI